MSSSISVGRFHLLDKLRGVAALMVVSEHIVRLYANSFINTPYLHAQEISLLDKSLYFLMQLATSGVSAVGFFFVLSGFVLSMSILSKDRFGVDIALFPLKRIVRLVFPVLAVFLVAYYLILNGMYNNAALAANFESSIAVKLNLAGMNDAILAGNLTSRYLYEWNGPVWTIAYELIGSLYLWLFVLVTLAVRYATNTQFSRIIEYVLIALVLMGTINSLYFGFFLGYLLARIKIDWLQAAELSCAAVRSISSYIMPLIGFLIIIINAALGPASYHLAMLGAFFIIAGVTAPIYDKANSGSSSAIGDRSYALYLIHYLVIAAVGGVVAGGNLEFTTPVFVIMLAAIFIATELVYRLVDKPALKFQFLLTRLVKNKVKSGLCKKEARILIGN